MTEGRYPHRFEFNDKGIKMVARIAALLELEDSEKAVSLSLHLAIQYAEACVKGHTEFVFCTPKEKSLFDNHPDFFKALCEEGVIEWLTPFVLGKSTIPPEENQ
jgi:hypothetical protein